MKEEYGYGGFSDFLIIPILIIRSRALTLGQFPSSDLLPSENTVFD